MTGREYNDNLVGQKEISKYLGVSVRTLTRMRKQYNDLPVKKLCPGGLSASKMRLNRWRRKKIGR